MARHKRKYHSNKKYKEIIDSLVLVPTKVLRIEEQNTVINDKFKTVFYCQSVKTPEGVMCVAWGKTSIREGDGVELKGRHKDGVFIVWSIQIKNRENQDN